MNKLFCNYHRKSDNPALSPALTALLGWCGETLEDGQLPEGATRESLTDELIEAIREGKLTDWQEDKLSFIGSLGVVDDLGCAKLGNIALDESNSYRVRYSALALIFKSKLGQYIFENVDMPTRVELSVPWYRSMLLMLPISTDSFPKQTLRALVDLSQTPEYQKRIVEIYEQQRVYYGICFDDVYEKLDGYVPAETQQLIDQYRLCGDLNSSH